MQVPYLNLLTPPTVSQPVVTSAVGGDRFFLSIPNSIKASEKRSTFPTEALRPKEDILQRGRCKRGQTPYLTPGPCWGYVDVTLSLSTDSSPSLEPSSSPPVSFFAISFSVGMVVFSCNFRCQEDHEFKANLDTLVRNDRWLHT